MDRISQKVVSGLRLTVPLLLLVAPCAERAFAEAPVESVFRADLSMVQVDVIVTDKSGHPVNDLSCDDFEVLEDNRPQAVSHCAFVASGSKAPNAPAPAAAAAVLRKGIERRDVERTIVLVVDDLSLDLQSAVSVHGALRSFVEDQMQPGDLVSVLRTGSGYWSLEQFTSDKRILMAAVDRVKFNPRAAAFLGSGQSPEDYASKDDALSEGTIAALRFALAALKDLPGRKAVVFFSAGWPLRGRTSPGRRAQGVSPFGDAKELTSFGEALTSIVELADRASAVIYTVDSLGVHTGQLTSQDRFSAELRSPDNQLTSVKQSTAPGVVDIYEGMRGLPVAFQVTPSASGNDRIDGLRALSEPTGGLLLQGSNDLPAQVGRILNDQRGYYLVGYVPRASSFQLDKGRFVFHKIRVKVRRPGLLARTRDGFYGVLPPESSGSKKAPPLEHALTSPFGANDVHVQLSSFFSRGKAGDDLIHALLRVRGGDLSFLENADGTLSARLDIRVAAFDADGHAVDLVGRAAELKIARAELWREGGLTYRVDFPVKKPGTYQLRAAVMDTASGRLGSSYEFAAVPDIRSGRLATSGILLTDATSKSDSTGLEPQTEDYSSRVLRVFAPGRSVEYGLTIYNARAGSKGAGQVTTEVRLLHEGREILKAEPHPLTSEGQPDGGGLMAGGILMLPDRIEEGDYILEVVITDALAGHQGRIALETTSFEVKKGVEQIANEELAY